MKRKPIFVANWKMNKSLHELRDYLARLKDGLSAIGPAAADVVLCPQSPLLLPLGDALKGGSFRLGAQNCGGAKFGAFTGEVSPALLKELGCEWVILGHSERRHVFKEEDALIAKRCVAALSEGLKVILCVGELLSERKAGQAFSVIDKQLSILEGEAFQGLSAEVFAVAYEPVWAIGTGETASPEQAQEVHAHIRKEMAAQFSAPFADALRVLYGGSVKPENSGSILAQKDVDGLLVGTASLDPAVFAGVIKNGLDSRR